MLRADSFLAALLPEAHSLICFNREIVLSPEQFFTSRLKNVRNFDSTRGILSSIMN
jgi:hypothetical protein